MTNDPVQEQEIDLIELFYKLLARWKWFVASLILALAAAFIYVHLVTPVYQASASIVIKETENQNKVVDELFAMANTQLPNTGTQIDDEMEILRSRSTLLQVVNELRLHTTYRIRKNFRYVEDTASPLVAILDEAAMDTLTGTLLLEIDSKKRGYVVTAALNDICRSTEFTGFPVTVETPAGKVMLRMTNDQSEWPGTMKIMICRPIDAVKSCASRLSVSTISKKTSIISLSYTDVSKRRAELFLSRLIEIYNRDAMEDKNKVTGNTLQFVTERLDSISRELGFVDKNLERYKLKERLSDIKTNMVLDLNTNNEYEKKLLDVETQLNMIAYIYEYLQDSSHHFSLLPINTGIADTELAKLVNEYNKELLERERLLHIMKENNPAVINQSIKIDALRRNVLNSLSGIKNGLLIARDDIMRKTNYFNTRIDNLPKQEREFNNIDRQQQIKANLYLMLLERREQAAISLAATINKARIIDAALAADTPVAPKSMMIYAGAGFLSFVFTAGIVLFGGIFRTKLTSLSELEAIGLPQVGTIPQMNDSERQVEDGRNDVIDEAFRRLRSNLRFMAEGDDKKCILVTSTMSAEGKSFTSINLALTFAFLGCKVLIVGLDIRRPRLAEFFKIKSEQGMTNYLSGNEVSLDSIIYPSGIHKELFVLPAGPVPPNPAEQLEKEKLRVAFDYLRKQFDYIIVDSAPVGMVSDTLSLGKITDFTLYVCRLNYTPKKALSIIRDLESGGQLNRISILVNGYNMSDDKYAYGKYGYGYGYGHKDNK